MRVSVNITLLGRRCYLQCGWATLTVAGYEAIFSVASRLLICQFLLFLLLNRISVLVMPNDYPASVK